MKKLIIVFAIITCCSNTMAAVTINYFNKDSKVWKWKVTMDGNTKEVIFDGSKTAAVTIQGTGKVCIIETQCGKVEIKDGMKIEIKDGCIKIL